MDFSSDLSFDASGSRLLSESPNLPSTSSSQADLSISELSLLDRPSSSSSKPFTLLAQPVTPVRPHPSVSEEGDDCNPNNEDGEGETTQRQINIDDDALSNAEEREQIKRTKAKLREDKLQSDIFVLRKLNAAFSSFNDALDGVGDANERIAQQLSQTEGLLNKYMGILAKSEEFARIIFDEEWEGAEQDDMIIQREEEERIERERREAEERRLAEQRERERLEREAKERREQEERERLERERKERAASRGVRGVRGTRASMRGMRGNVPSTRGSTNTSRGSSAGPSRVPPPSRLGRGTIRRG
ncbi:hypothetical protein FB446DRAFT_726585 [Lentinula raphanica]|nr:hypothetical protein FB446DRAFT_726585 [Lentinula raphanica]